MTYHEVLDLLELKHENIVFLAINFRLQLPTLRHTGISCCRFMAEVFLLPVAIKLPFFAGKCSEMRNKARAVMILEHG